MLKLPFKYFLQSMDEMARPAISYTDSSGEQKSYEPIASVPYFMSKIDIYYLYQFPPSLWPEAFHYRINNVFRDFIENLKENEDNKLSGKSPVPWNDKRTVVLEWKGTNASGAMKDEKGADSKIIKYEFPNIKTFIYEYWDSLQRDVDTEFFAKHDDTEEARAEYEKILQKAMADNADTGGFFGTSLRDYSDKCDISTVVKKKVRGQEVEVEEKGTIWSCIGYRPVGLEAVSDQIKNWIAASHHGWTSSHVDPAYKNGSSYKEEPKTIPNKGPRNFDAKFVANNEKLKAIRNKILHTGGTPFQVTANGYVTWKNEDVKRTVQYVKTEIRTTEDGRKVAETIPVHTDSDSVRSANSDADAGIYGLEKMGRLPLLEPGYKVDSKSAEGVDQINGAKDFSELPKEVLNKLMVASKEDFEQMSSEIGKNAKNYTRAPQRLEDQLKRLVKIREILDVVNSDEAMQDLKTKLHEQEVASKNDKEKASLRLEYKFVELFETLKKWADAKKREIGSYKADDFEHQFVKLRDQYKEIQNTHFSYEASAHKQKMPNDEERTNMSKNDSSRKDMLKQMESAFNSYEFLSSMDSSGRITASNVIPLLSIYLREIQANAKKYDAFSYAIATHNNQRQDRNPLGLDMNNPLSVGEKKYPGLGDKTRGFGTFSPNNTSKQRLNANEEQWEQLKKHFSSAEMTEFPFNQEEIQKLMDEGRKYLGKVLDYIAGRKDILDYLDMDSHDVHTIALTKMREKVREASKTDRTPPDDLTIVMGELKNIADQLSNLSDVSKSGTIDSAIKEGIDYALKVRTGGDQIASAAKYDPSFPTSLEYAKEYIAKAAETYLMRASGSGPLMYWLSASKDPHIKPLQKLKIYLGAREEVKEIVKNYIYTLCQLPQSSNDTALALSRKKRKDFSGEKQTSQIGQSGGESDFNMDDQIVQQMDANNMSIHTLMQSPAFVKVIKSSLFDNSDPTQGIETVIRNDFRKIMPQSHTFGPGVEKGTVIGQDVEEFRKFITQAIAAKVEKAQDEKGERLQKLKSLDADVDTKQDNDVMSTIGFASLLYSLMELEVDQQYGKELSGIKNSKERDERKTLLVKQAMKDWKSKNIASSGQRSISSPDLNNPDVAKQLSKSFSRILEDQKEFEKEEINVSNIPPTIRSPEVVNAMEVLAAIVHNLPKDERGSFDFSDLEREIRDLDVGSGSPWENDPNKEYKINVALLSLGDPMKYKQAATAVEAPEEERITPGQMSWIKDRIKTLSANKSAAPEEDKPFKHFPAPNKPMPGTSAPATPAPTAPAPQQAPAPKPAPSGGLAGFLNKRASLHKPKQDSEDDF